MFCANCLFHIEYIPNYREQVCYTKHYVFCCEWCFHLWYNDQKNWKIREDLAFSYFKKKGEEDARLRAARPLADRVCTMCAEREKTAIPIRERLKRCCSGLRTKK